MKGKKFLSDLKLHSDYLKWNSDKSRYETWEEAQEDIINGHREKYKEYDIESYLESALESQKNQLVLASQRNLQYRYPEIQKHNIRMYNCCGSLLAKNIYFQQYFYILLCGTGLDFSVRKIFIENLSNIKKRENGTVTYVIKDSIEGWADALGVLLSSYFIDNQPFPEYADCKIRFDFSQIREKGSFISGGFRAPGPDGLKQSLERIEKLLDNWIETEGNVIRPILAYDIIMHISDAVLSGGVRRCLAKGSKVLTEKGTYKLIEDIVIGDSVKTMNGYKKVTNTFVQGKQNTIKITHQGGEINCTRNHKIACFNGEKVIWKLAGDLEGDELLVFNNLEYEGDYINKLPEFSYNKPLMSTTCTDIVIPELDEDMAYLIGIIQGDGYIHLESGRGQISIAVEGNNLEKAEKIKTIANRFGVNFSIFSPREDDNCYKIRCSSKQLAEYLQKHVKKPKTAFKVPDFILNSSNNIKKAYITGIFCSDGSFKTRPALVCSSVYKEFLKELQCLLSSLGVTSNIKNMTFKSRKSHWQDLYSLNVRGISNFNNFYNLLLDVKKKKDKKLYIKGLSNIKNSIENIQPIKINSIEEGENLETFDIEVADEHSFICEGVLVHNSACSILIDEDDTETINAKIGNWREENPQRARSNNAIGLIRKNLTKDKLDKILSMNQGDNDISFIIVEDEFEISNPCREITFRPVLPNGEIAIQLCNLCEINAEKCTTRDKFLRACTDASILGTLQAGYTDFPYLGKDTEDLVKREALLGVSITGWMNNPKLFNPELLKEGAQKVIDTNEELSSIIGINPAARTTCIKPSGNVSVVLGTASGIHPEHSERYFRVMQLNKESDTAKWLNENMPFLLEESVWSATNSDYVVFVPIINPKEGLYKKDMKGIKHLELIKLVQENWVNSGTNTKYCLKPWLKHSVSCTVIIDNIKDMTEYIFENRDNFKAVSFLSDYGDKDFNQAPFTSVKTMGELVEEYGKGVLLVSGLIVDGLHYFHDNLWEACDYILESDKELSGTREQVLLKEYWLKRVKKFSKNYFKGDIKKTIYCLKDLHLFHKWETINRQFKEVDFSKILTKPEYKDVSNYASMACSGGSCEITRI